MHSFYQVLGPWSWGPRLPSSLLALSLFEYLFVWLSCVLVAPCGTSWLSCAGPLVVAHRLPSRRRWALVVLARSSLTRDWTHVPCTARLYHCPTREFPVSLFSFSGPYIVKDPGTRLAVSLGGWQSGNSITFKVSHPLHWLHYPLVILQHFWCVHFLSSQPLNKKAPQASLRLACLFLMLPRQSQPVQVLHHCIHNDDLKSLCLSHLSQRQNRISTTQYTSPTGCASGPHSPQVQLSLTFPDYHHTALSCILSFWMLHMREMWKSAHLSLTLVSHVQ